MMPTLSQTILAVAAEITSAEDWIHLCCTAADEAEAAEVEARPNALDNPARLIMHLVELEEVVGEEHQRELQSLGDVAREYAAGRLVREQGTSAAAIAFAANLPPLTRRKNVQAYVACVAVGMARGYFTGKGASTMLYAAQAALSAHPKRGPRQPKPAPAKAIGFAS